MLYRNEDYLLRLSDARKNVQCEQPELDVLEGSVDRQDSTGTTEDTAIWGCL